jgi:hypothetical protein
MPVGRRTLLGIALGTRFGTRSGTALGTRFGTEFGVTGTGLQVASFGQLARWSGATAKRSGATATPPGAHRNGARRAACLAAWPIDRLAAAAEG